MFKTPLTFFLLACFLLLDPLGLTKHAQAEDTADKRPTKTWNRTGPLGDTPKHVTDSYPLSDQENRGRWIKFEPMSDEFVGDDLDLQKWNRGLYWWKGRQPALFRDENVTVSDGKIPFSEFDRKQRMKIAAYLAISLVSVCLIIFLVWRLASRRRSLPCPVWLRWLVELDNPFTKTNRAAVIIEHLGLQPGMAVIDVGCGPGRLTIPLAKQVGEQGEVVAMDMQAGMLDRARQKAEESKLKNIRFLHAGVGEGRLETNQFDRALLVTVLGEIPDREAALKEIFDSLKAGGILSVTEIMFDPHFQGRHTVARLAELAGFRPTAFFGNRIAYTLHLAKPKDD
jgi:precorrin-6B methylase 2